MAEVYAHKPHRFPGEHRGQQGRWHLAGGMAGIFQWSVALPPDVLKTRLQSAPEGQFKNTREVFRHLMKEQGPKGLFKGAGPVMTRAFPANACCFLGYEAAISVMNKFAPDL